MAPIQNQTEKRQRDARGRFVNGNKEGHRFKPGESGNPGGRPAGVSITAEMNELLQSDPDVILKSKPKTGAALLARGIFRQATTDDATLAKEIWNRTDGKVPDKTELTGKDGGAIVMSLLTPEEQRKRARAILEDAAKEANDSN